jgi:hypothetical protein
MGAEIHDLESLGFQIACYLLFELESGMVCCKSDRFHKKL